MHLKAERSNKKAREFVAIPHLSTIFLLAIFYSTSVSLYLSSQRKTLMLSGESCFSKKMFNKNPTNCFVLNQL
jgi:hypothetical protein